MSSNEYSGSDDKWSCSDSMSTDEEEEKLAGQLGTIPTAPTACSSPSATHPSSMHRSIRSANRQAPYTIPLPSHSPASASRDASLRTAPTTNTDELMNIALQKLIKMFDRVESQRPDEHFWAVLREILQKKNPEDKLKFKMKTLQLALALPNAVDPVASSSNAEEFGQNSGTGPTMTEHLEFDSD